MGSNIGRMILVVAILALPVTGYAQQASVIGTVTDTTGAVLPGVTVRALHEASGNTFEAVTDGRGAYRIPLRVGLYRITGQLQGFATVTQTGLELLVGQQAVVNLQMAVSAVEASVTVTGQLMDVTSSTLGRNIDPRQMEELPVNGRNWMDLSLLAPGSRQNAATEVPLDRQGYFQVTVDGQQVTNLVCCSQQQPRYSRDAIAEFEIVTNRFDATQGRTAGQVVNAITKSGTNSYLGTLSGYFRHDTFNAADFIEHRVLPYSNQQVSATFGGPIRRDRIHIFGNYEYEREPRTVTFSSPFPSFNIDQSVTRGQHLGGLRLDTQFSPQTRLAARGNMYRQDIPFSGAAGGASNHPSAAAHEKRNSDQLWLHLTHVVGNRSANEVKGGFAIMDWSSTPPVEYPVEGTARSFFIFFRGYTVGSWSPEHDYQKSYIIRDDFTTSFTGGGRHDLKLGGEFLEYNTVINSCCPRLIFATGGEIPANIEALLPVWNDASTWNLAPLSPIVQAYRTIQRPSSLEADSTNHRHLFAGWVQDDWKIGQRLTLNLGVRYDVDIGGMGESVKLLPWLSGDRSHDLDNIAPRLGFAFSLNDRTVIRGGYGKFFTELENDPEHNPRLMANWAPIVVVNDGRPDFAANPFNGPAPTYDQIVANFCDTALRPGCFLRDITIEIPGPVYDTSYSHQASIGVQRQLGATTVVTADYVFTGGRLEETGHNANLGYNPSTGVNYPFSDRNRRPFPEWGAVFLDFTSGWSNYRGLETAITKRFSNRWQASATYTLSGFWDSYSNPPVIEVVNGRAIQRKRDFNVAPDLGEDYTLAETDQRHRAVFNGIWDVGYGFQMSGLYFFGSGQRYRTSYGGGLRDLGIRGITAGAGPSGGSERLRPDGTIVPRNNLVGEPIHRVDLRVLRRFQLGDRARIEGILEVFNLFNHANYGSYVTQESNPNYGRPSYDSNIAFQPRMLQLGFRFTF